MRTLGVLAAGGLGMVFAASQAHAQASPYAPLAGPQATDAPWVRWTPPPGPPSRPPTTDSAWVTGIVDIALGASLVGLGALIDDGPAQGSFVGAGLGTLTPGIALAIAGAAPVRYERESEAAYATGSVLVSIGGTFAGLGLGNFIANEIQAAQFRREFGGAPSTAFGFPLVMMGLGTLVSGVGAGLMTFGAAELAPHEVQQRAEQRTVQKRLEVDEEGTVAASVPRRTAGQVVTVIGGVSLLGGTLAAVSIDGGGDSGGLGHLLVTAPLFANGIIASAVGIPLWISGAARVPVDGHPSKSEPGPTVRVGAGDVSLTVPF